MLKRLFFAIWLAGIAVEPASAGEILYRGVRPLAMGDAFTAVANDENAAFYNPAGLHWIETPHTAFLTPQVDIGTIPASLISPCGTEIDTATITDTLRGMVGKRQYLRGSLLTDYLRRDIQLGILLQARLEFEVHQPSYPYVDVDSGTDIVYFLGVAQGVWDDALKMGFSPKLVQRNELAKRYTVTDISSSNFDFMGDVKSGSAVGLDFGAIYTTEMMGYETSFGVAGQNIGRLNFSGGVNSVPAKVNLGASMRIPFDMWFGPYTLLAALDFKDVWNFYGPDRDIPKRFHFGMELPFNKYFTLRAGIKQSYWTYGAALAIGILKFSYANYTEELGGYGGQRGDVRNVLEVAAVF